MSAGGARRGRRDNGLHATEYAVAGDVDPRVGEHLLDVLAAAGIAAYLQPSADLNPVTRTTTVPSRPTDRFYVDRAHLATARDYLRQLADENAPRESTNDPDVEAEWARIVAGFHTETAEDTPDEAPAPDPARDRSAGPADRVEGGAGPAGGSATGGLSGGGAPPRAGQEGGAGNTGVRRLPWATDISGISVGGRVGDGRVDDGRTGDGSLLDGLDSFGAGFPDEESDERYVPPPPPPLPRISKYAVAGVLAVVLGFALFLFPALLPLDRGLVIMVGFVSILGGFITLVMRLRPGDEEDVDPGDGAVV